MSLDVHMEEPIPLHISPLEVEQRIQYKLKRKQFIIRQLHNIMEYVATLFACYCIAYAILLFHQIGYSCLACLLLWCILYASRIVRLSLYLRYQLESDKRKHIICMVIKNALNVLSYLGILIFYFFKTYNLLVCIILAINIAAILPLIGYTKPKNTCFGFMRCIKVLMAIVRSVTISLVLLFYSKFINFALSNACMYFCD